MVPATPWHSQGDAMRETGCRRKRLKWARIPHWALLSVMTLALDGVVVYEVLKKLLVFRQTNNVSCFPGGSDGKESACKAEDLGSIIGLGRSPGGRAWQLTPVFLPEESQRTEELNSPWGHKESDMTE